MGKKLTRSILSEDVTRGYDTIPTTCIQQEKYNRVEKRLLQKIDFRHSGKLLLLQKQTC